MGDVLNFLGISPFVQICALLSRMSPADPDRLNVLRPQVWNRVSLRCLVSLALSARSLPSPTLLPVLPASTVVP